MADKDELGRRGEDLAVRYLQDHGVVVLSRNWRCRAGELDVVGVHGERLVVCEVKTRSGTRFGQPAEAVDGRKIARIRKVTHAWLAAHHVGGWTDVRFDVCAVLMEPGRPATVQHYVEAF